MQTTGTLSKIKNRFVPGGARPRTVLFGPMSGLVFNIDLRHQTQFMLGLYETEVNHWLQRLSGGVCTFIDVGAAFGALTLYGLAKTRASTVIAFEPDAASRSALNENTGLNDVDADGLILEDQLVGQVDTRNQCTLDAYIDNIQQPCFVKVDVDGGEEEVLRGAERVLEMNDVRWIIETHSEQLEIDCLKILEEHGYHVVIVDNAWWRAIIPEQRPIPHNRWIVAYKALPGS